MRTAHAIAVTAFGLVLLAACSPNASASSSASGAASATAPDAETPVVDLKGLPHVAVGYWELTEKDGDNPAKTSRFCQADAPLWARFVDDSGNTTQAFSRNGRGEIIDTATTKQNGFTLVDRSVYSGDLAKAYVIDETTKTTGPTQDPQTEVLKLTFRLIGPCPPAGK